MPKRLKDLWSKCLAFAVIAAIFAGCSTQQQQNRRPFSFQEDTLSYANELSWEYFYDADGKWRSKRREPPPRYCQHCFVVARSARQFFSHAQFDATQPRLNEEEYRKLVHTIVHRSFVTTSVTTNRIVVPGYANLREFSRDHEQVLKDECGGAWHSYFQRGHWRMLLPFSRNGQEQMASALLTKVKNGAAPVIHLVRFPQLTINHAALLFDATELPDRIEFAMYDPNYPEKPATLTFHKKTKNFELPANTYFPGGKVNVYEVYKSLTM